jgi:hypothetical protein
MDYTAINQTLGRAIVSRIEDDVLHALQVSQQATSGGEALRQLLVAMLGSVILSNPNSEQAACHEQIVKSMHEMSIAVAQVQCKAKHAEIVQSEPALNLTRSREVMSQTGKLVEEIRHHLNAMSELQSRASSSIAATQEALAKSSAILSLEAR